MKDIYTIDSHITSIEEVKEFFSYLVDEKHLNFHPDDDFNDYINMDTKERTFTISEADLYNRLMDECFDICETEGEDIYAIALHFIEI